MDLCYHTAAFCRRVRHHRCGPSGAGQRSGSQGDLGPVLVAWLRRSALAEGSGTPRLCPSLSQGAGRFREAQGYPERCREPAGVGSVSSDPSHPPAAVRRLSETDA